MKKLLLQSCIWAVIGACIEAVLNSFGFAFYYKTPVTFLFIIFVLPFFILIKFIPFYLLSILMLKIINGLNKKLTPVIFAPYIAIIAVCCGFILNILGVLSVYFIDSVVFNAGYSSLQSVFEGIFSLEKPVPSASGFIPALPRIYYLIFSLISVLILSIAIFLYQGKRLKQRSNDTIHN